MKHIYVVEDDPLTSSVVMTALRKAYDANVVVFDDGSSAIAACRSCFPDVLILDYQMPGMSGIEVFCELKNEFPTKTLVIMASAIDDGSMVLKFIQQGIRNYVIKDEHFIDSIMTIINEEMQDIQ